MKFGEHKSLTTDRVILIPGPRWEVAVVRKMFQLALDGLGCTAIARELNRQGLRCQGRPWAHRQVILMLTNPKYTGCNVWNRTSQKLGGKLRRTQPTEWIMKLDAFAPIVDRDTFDQVQILLQQKATAWLWTDEEIVKCLKRLLARKGRLSESIIQRARGTPSKSTIRKHLGSWAETYKRVGFEYDPHHVFRGLQTGRSYHLRGEIHKQLTDLFPDSVTVTHLPGGGRSVLRVDDRFTVSIILCRTKRRKRAPLHWVVEPNPAERELITLLCTMNPSHSAILEYYLFPRMDVKSHRSREGDPWLAKGVRLKNLSEFYGVAKHLSATRKLYSMAS